MHKKQFFIIIMLIFNIINAMESDNCNQRTTSSKDLLAAYGTKILDDTPIDEINCFINVINAINSFAFDKENSCQNVRTHMQKLLAAGTKGNYTATDHFLRQNFHILNGHAHAARDSAIKLHAHSFKLSLGNPDEIILQNAHINLAYVKVISKCLIDNEYKPYKLSGNKGG